VGSFAGTLKTYLISCPTSDVIERIAKFIRSDPELLADPSRFILGLGWDQTKWAGGEFPRAVCPLLAPLLSKPAAHLLPLM
jgi:hypothetical protein